MRVIGTASGYVEHKFLHGDSQVGHIEDVVVLDNYRGMGVGSRLVKHLVSWFRAHSCYKAILDCEKHNAPFYEKLGFHQKCIQMRIDL